MTEIRPTDLHNIQNGVLRMQRYTDEIFRPYVGPYDVATGDSFRLVHDNVKVHTVEHGVENMLETETTY